MKMKHALTALLLTALTAAGQIAPSIKYEIESNLQQTQTLPVQSFQQGAAVEMQFSIRSSGRWLNLTGLTANWYGQELATSTQRLEQVSVETVTSSTPHYFRIKLDSGATGTARTNWLWNLMIVEVATQAQYPVGTGPLDIVASSWTGAQAMLVTPTVEAYLEARLDGIEGEITTNVLASLTWENVTGKPFDELSELNTNNLTGVTWTDFVTGTPWDLEGYLQQHQTLKEMIASGRAVVGDDSLPATNHWITMESRVDEGQSGILFKYYGLGGPTEVYNRAIEFGVATSLYDEQLGWLDLMRISALSGLNVDAISLFGGGIWSTNDLTLASGASLTNASAKAIEAHGWGDHALAGYAISTNAVLIPTGVSITNDTATLSWSDGSPQRWNIDIAAVTNIVLVGAGSNYLSSVELLVFPGTNDVSGWQGTWLSGAAEDVTNVWNKIFIDWTGTNAGLIYIDGGSSL